MKISKDLKKCINYHGHLCGGLLMGWRASKAAMKYLKENFSKDEELVAIVENSSCYIDAVSVITGCSFGKGNLIFKDYGKMVMYLLSRNTGKGVRVSFKEIYKNNDNFREIMNKVLEGKASKEEIKYFNKFKKDREEFLMKAKDSDILIIREVKKELPPKARIYKSIKCSKCGEMAMETRIKEINGENFCLECLEDEKN